MKWLNAYWFKPASLYDLATVRIVVVGTWFLLILFHVRTDLSELTWLTSLPEGSYSPRKALRVLTSPFDWPNGPPLAVIETLWYVGAVAGLLAVFGLLTNVSLFVLASCSLFLQSYAYAFRDIHHPDAAMIIMLFVLALSPCGRRLSLDSLIRGRFNASSAAEPSESEFARWPIVLMQWFFVLMYFSAVYSKLSNSGLDWANGYTLQYFLIQDGLRWDSPIALFLAQFHTLVFLLQCLVLVFQATFIVPVVFPIARWVYVPLGLCLHIAILITMKATFFEWIALYAVFIPWRRAYQLLSSGQWRQGLRPQLSA